ncbi:hypothetical protein B0H13DRAFT_1872873 [Mycena leptocephala]|nr:hypothetical protein B0H13DRAFT_1872873 [Mycena leptocephala]
MVLPGFPLIRRLVEFTEKSWGSNDPLDWELKWIAAGFHLYMVNQPIHHHGWRVRQYGLGRLRSYIDWRVVSSRCKRLIVLPEPTPFAIGSRCGGHGSNGGRGKRERDERQFGYSSDTTGSAYQTSLEGGVASRQTGKKNVGWISNEDLRIERKSAELQSLSEDPGCTAREAEVSERDCTRSRSGLIWVQRKVVSGGGGGGGGVRSEIERLSLTEGVRKSVVSKRGQIWMDTHQKTKTISFRLPDDELALEGGQSKHLQAFPRGYSSGSGRSSDCERSAGRKLKTAMRGRSKKVDAGSPGPTGLMRHRRVLLLPLLSRHRNSLHSIHLRATLSICLGNTTSISYHDAACARV